MAGCACWHWRPNPWGCMVVLTCIHRGKHASTIAGYRRDRQTDEPQGGAFSISSCRCLTLTIPVFVFKKTSTYPQLLYTSPTKRVDTLIFIATLNLASPRPIRATNLHPRAGSVRQLVPIRLPHEISSSGPREMSLLELQPVELNGFNEVRLVL